MSPRSRSAPAPRTETVRQRIRTFLEEGAPATAREISGEVRIPEREVFGHLAHLERTLHRQGMKLVVLPAECRHCGFVFRKRDRLSKPGRCPVCRHTSVSEPLFGIGR